MDEENINDCENEDNNTINSKDILDAIDINKINQVEKKKRGRPKKTEQMMTSSSKIKTTNNNEVYNLEEEEIILHLPISKSDLSKIDTDTDFSINNILEKQNLQTSDSSESSENINESKNIDELENNQYIKHLYLIIKKLKDENTELKKYLADLSPMYFTEVKIFPTGINLVDTNNNKITPKKTNNCCRWCTYKFNNLPVYLPIKYSNNIYYILTKEFCSFNCAIAYNNIFTEDKKEERESLLKKLYYDINKDKIKSISEIKIIPSGDIDLLDKYGGPLTIDEYRNKSKYGIEYHKLSSSFIQVNTGFLEILTSNTNFNNILNLSKNDNNILLKREKPLNNSASKYIDNFIINNCPK